MGWGTAVTKGGRWRVRFGERVGGDWMASYHCPARAAGERDFAGLEEERERRIHFTSNVCEARCDCFETERPREIYFYFFRGLVFWNLEGTTLIVLNYCVNITRGRKLQGKARPGILSRLRAVSAQLEILNYAKLHGLDFCATKTRTEGTTLVHEITTAPTRASRCLCDFRLVVEGSCEGNLTRRI